jgi:hypothetical protein
MKLDDVLNVMRRGATLHLSLADKPTWKLNNGVTEVTINSRAVQSMLKRGAIVGNGDSLFSDIPSQTFRFRPHLNWKRSGKSYSARGGSPGFGVYVLIWNGLDEPFGYCVNFHTVESVSDVSAYRIPKLEDAQALAELHRDKRTKLIREYGDKRNVPREAWMKFRDELRAWQEVRFGPDAHPTTCKVNEGGADAPAS